jgi:glycosyltransferase involved in cell wall biosynthesis
MAPTTAIVTGAAGPRITVITAVRNGSATLQRALDSVFEQTHDRVELVVMDGASTDGTQAILERNAARIRYWESAPDRGIYHAWNKALAHATGDWICFLGADDRLHSPEVLADVAAALAADEGRHRVAFGDLDKYRPDGSVSHRTGRRWGKKRRQAFRRGVMIPHPSTFHHRSLFEEHGPFDERFVIAGDFEFLLRELLRHDPLHIPVTVADMSPGGLSDRPSTRPLLLREVYRARYMHGITKEPPWRSKRLHWDLSRLWVRQHLTPRVAQVRAMLARAPGAGDAT